MSFLYTDDPRIKAVRKGHDAQHETITNEFAREQKRVAAMGRDMTNDEKDVFFSRFRKLGMEYEKQLTAVEQQITKERRAKEPPRPNPRYSFGSEHDFAHRVTGKALPALPVPARRPCPSCPAPAGERCRTRSGEPTRFHVARERGTR